MICGRFQGWRRDSVPRAGKERDRCVMSKRLKLEEVTADANGAPTPCFRRAPDQLSTEGVKNGNIGVPFKLESRSRGGHRRGHPDLLPLQVHWAQLGATARAFR
jgi:hypothetical protein